TPSGSCASTVSEADAGSSLSRSARRLTGVKRHSSSRPVTEGKSARSKLRGRSWRPLRRIGRPAGLSSVCVICVLSPGGSVRDEGSGIRSAQGTLHLQFDELVEFERVLHGELAGD